MNDPNSSLQYDLGSVIIGEGSVNNLDFHREGKWLLCTTDEGTIHIVDALSGEERKKLYVKTNGIGKAKFTHHEACILHSHDKKIYDIKYLCTYDNRYISSFSGHTNRVTSISMSPVEDHFISSSIDRSILIWDMAQQNHVANITLPSIFDEPYVSFDEGGLVFGVLCQNSLSKRQHLKLFDARNHQAGPFQDIVPEGSLLANGLRKAFPSYTEQQLRKAIQTAWSSFEFCTDGNHLLINTVSDFLYVLDGFRSDVEPLVIPRKNELNLTLGTCFSANAKFIIAANDDNEMQIFDKQTGEQRSVLTGHVSSIGCIRCNPRYDEIASGCGNIVLWIPKVP